MLAGLHNCVGLPQAVLEDIWSELNEVLNVVNDEAIRKDIVDRIVYEDPVEITDIAACAIPILDFSLLDDGRPENDETDMSGSRRAPGFCRWGPHRVPAGIGVQPNSIAAVALSRSGNGGFRGKSGSE